MSPILFIISILIFLDDGFPIIFKQKRFGINNKLFSIYKFRTMKKDTPDIPSHHIENPKNLYTKIGPILRKLSLDEFPQLLNIIKGEMVFIGPRPALYNQSDLIKMRTEFGIHYQKPGVTGFAQINGRDNLSLKEKVDYENYYLNNHSISVDIKILFQTIVQLLFPKGVNH